MWVVQRAVQGGNYDSKSGNPVYVPSANHKLWAISPDVERNLNKRLIFEIINIKSQSKSLNLQTDMDSLDRAYFSCISNI